MPITLRILCFVTAVLCNEYASPERAIPQRSFLSRRAIDGTRGRKYFIPEEEGTFDSYGSAGGQYDPYEEKTDLSDIRRNVPGEPGIDYPAYTILPQTGFSCEGRSRGYYADEEAGCQIFHVCHDVLVSSFLCPIGSIFSQRLMTCDWWNKVDCTATRKFIAVNRESYNQADDDEMIRKAYAMIGLQSGKDVSHDELVDPDRNGRIVDYVTIDGGSSRNSPSPRNEFVGRLPSISADFKTHANVDANADDQGRRASPNYRDNAFYGPEHRLSPAPYHDTPIIRIRKIGQKNYDDVRVKNEFEAYDDFRGRPVDRFQPSYAPTVPTVTTTTRRFYSPTVPTTYRSSTLAYGKLDLAVDGSDNLFAHSHETEVYATPPMITRSFREEPQNDEKSFVGFGEGRQDQDRRNLESVGLYGGLGGIYRLNHRTRYGTIGHADEGEKRGTEDDVKSYEDIETKESIGLGRAFDQPGKIRIPIQDLRDDERSKDQRDSRLVYGSKETSTIDRGRFDNVEFVSGKTTTASDEIGEYASAFGRRTTPLLKIREGSAFETEDYQSKDKVPSTTSAYAESTIEKSTLTNDRGESPESPLRAKTLPNPSGEKVNLASSFLPARRAFRIKVPDFPTTKVPASLIDYTNIDDRLRSNSETTKSSLSVGTSLFDAGKETVSLNDGDIILSTREEETSNATPKHDASTESKTTEFPSTISWSTTSPWSDRTAERPSTRIVPPIIGYDDVYDDFGATDSKSGSQVSFTRNETDFGDDYGFADGESRSRTLSSPTRNDTGRNAANYGIDLDFPNSDIAKAGVFNISTNSEEVLFQVPLSSIKNTTDYGTGFEFTNGNAERGRANVSSNGKERFRVPSNLTRNDNERNAGHLDTGFEFTIRDALQGRTSGTLPCSSSLFDLEERPCPTFVDDAHLATTVLPEILESYTARDIETSKLPDSLTSIFEGTKFSSVTNAIPGTLLPPVVTLSSRLEPPSNIDNAMNYPIATREIAGFDIAKQSDKVDDKGKSSVSSPIDEFLHPEILSQIEETIERSKSPYQLSLTVNSDDRKLIPNGNDLISRLIARHEKENSAVFKLDDIEIVKSVQTNDRSSVTANPGIRPSITPNGTIPTEITEPLGLRKVPFDITEGPISQIQNVSSLAGNSNVRIYDNTKIFEEKNSTNLGNVNTLSLLQLMAELLKIDRIPRPFALNDLGNIETTTNPDSISNVHNQSVSIPETTDDRSKTKMAVADSIDSYLNYRNVTKHRDVATKESFRTEAGPLLKEQILKRLTENFGRPIYTGNVNGGGPFHRAVEATSINGQPLIFELPQVQRSLDFETGLPLENRNARHESTDPPESELLLANSSAAYKTTTSTSTSTSSLGTSIATTESAKTIVETEFVPSLGFSFDTSEGREKYVEAVLGGLFKDPVARNERNHSIEFVDRSPTSDRNVQESIVKKSS